MHVTSVERSEVPYSHPVETAPPPRDTRISHIFNTIVSGAIGRPFVPSPTPESSPLRQAFDEIVRQNFGQESKVRSYLPDAEKVKDLGRLAMVKWQARTASIDLENSWINRRPWLRRTATLLGSAAAATTVWTLASRTTQAYAMTRHGMHFGFEHIPDPMDSTLPSDIDHAASPPEVTKPTPAMVLASQQADGTLNHDIQYNSSAKTIHHSEGWFNQFRQMGIHGSNAQLDNLLDNVGGELHDRGLAYYDRNANEWRMNLVDPNSSGSGYHHANGEGSLREQDLDYIMREAADHNLVEHRTNNDNAEHKHPPTQPAPPSEAPEQPNNPDLNQPSASKPDIKDVSWVEASENWVEAQWDDMISTWKHFIELDWKDLDDELKNAWNATWRNWNWAKALGLGGILLLMRKYEDGRQAYNAAHPGSTQLRTIFTPVSWRNPRTWRNVDWGAWRHRPIAVEESTTTVTTSPPQRHTRVP